MSSDSALPQPSSIEDAVHRLQWAAERSGVYHEMRQTFFDRVDRWIKLVTLVSGSGAVIALLKSSAFDPRVALYLSAFGAVLSLLNLTLRTSEMATRHAQLKQKFIALQISLKKIDTDASDAAKEIKALEIERLTIEKDEPPKHCYVDIKAHNELCRAKDYADCWHLRWHQRALAHVIRGTSNSAITVKQFEERPKSRMDRILNWITHG